MFALSGNVTGRQPNLDSLPVPSERDNQDDFAKGLEFKSSQSMCGWSASNLSLFIQTGKWILHVFFPKILYFPAQQPSGAVVGNRLAALPGAVLSNLRSQGGQDFHCTNGTVPRPFDLLFGGSTVHPSRHEKITTRLSLQKHILQHPNPIQSPPYGLPSGKLT